MPDLSKLEFDWQILLQKLLSFRFLASTILSVKTLSGVYFGNLQVGSEFFSATKLSNRMLTNADMDFVVLAVSFS